MHEDWHARNHCTKSPQLLLGGIYKSQKRYQVAQFVEWYLWVEDDRSSWKITSVLSPNRKTLSARDISIFTQLHHDLAMTVSWKTSRCLANSFTFTLASKFCDCSFLKPLPRVDPYHMPTDIRRRIALSKLGARVLIPPRKNNQFNSTVSPSQNPSNQDGLWDHVRFEQIYWFFEDVQAQKYPICFFLGGKRTYVPMYLWPYEPLNPIYYPG